MKVVFRVDTGEEIGSGHFMRCLTLANHLRKNGGEFFFICDDGLDVVSKYLRRDDYYLFNEDQNRSFEFNESIKEKNEYKSWVRCGWKEDARQTKNIIGKSKPDWLVVDHYGIDSQWHNELRSSVNKIMVIDDLANRALDCDMVVDQTYGRLEQCYSSLVGSNCECLLGVEYAMIRPEFKALREISLRRRELKSSIDVVFVFMGGADHLNLTEKVINALSEIVWNRSAVVNVALSSSAPYLDEVIQAGKKINLDVNIHVDSNSMAELMMQSDIGIGAAGTASWERCVMGLPTMITAYADNQRIIAENLVRSGAVQYWSDVGSLKNKIEKLIGCPEELQHMSSTSAGICDGIGCQRVVSAMTGSLG